jgi:DNA helicase TIP49 (TBP-interacting protein)
MDGITAAVAIIGQKQALQQVDAVTRMIRSNEEATRGLVEMITASAGSGKLYSNSGVVQQTQVAQELNTTA